MTDELLAGLKRAAPGAEKIELAEAQVKEYPTFRVPAAELRKAVQHLKDEEGFDYLDLVTAVDWLGPTVEEGFIKEPNPNPYVPDNAPMETLVPVKNPKVAYREAFDVVVLLTSIEKKAKVALKAETPRSNPSVPSLVPLYKAADWMEREVYDLLGVKFEGHPDLRKILNPDFIQGHPLRKDYVHRKDHLD